MSNLTNRSARARFADDIVQNAQRNLDAFKREFERLETARRKLLSEIARVDQAIAETRLNNRAHPNQAWADQPGLVELLGVMLTGRSMTITEATDALLAVGYRSDSKDFKRLVGHRLYSSGRFVRVGPVTFTAR